MFPAINQVAILNRERQATPVPGWQALAGVA